MNDDETWVEGDHANTLNSFDAGDVRTTHAIIAHGVSASDDQVAGTLCTNSQGGQRTTDIAGAYVTQAYSIREDDASNTFSATPIDAARCLQKHQPSVQSHHAQTFIAETFPIDDGRDLEKHQNGTGVGDAGAPAYTLDRQQRPAVAQTVSSMRDDGVMPTLTKRCDGSSMPDGRGQPIVSEQMSVRRLTPTECERLMGWPDEWTAPEGVKAPDSKRYAACGDGIVAPVAFWIADRIRMIEGEA
jgi:site-specific DNA-cytosine methylase